MLWIPPGLTKKLVFHAREQYPLEACGLLLGDLTRMKVTDVVFTKNIAKHPETQFRIDDRQLARHLPDVIGFYHSHPKGNAISSRADIQEACYPDYVQLIVGLNNNTDAELAAWEIRDYRVKRVPLHISNSPLWTNMQETVSENEKYVIVLSIILGVVAVIAIAVMLLPPAPPIP